MSYQGFPQTGRPYNGLTQVSGIDGAKAYMMPPNSVAALFHNSEDVFYVKSTDGAGFPTIRTFKFEEVSCGDGSSEYAKKSELDELKGMLADVEQLVREVRKSVEPVEDCGGRKGKPAGGVRADD